MKFDFFIIISFIIFLALTYVLIVLKKNNVDFGLRTIIAMFMGLCFGVFFKDKLDYVDFVGKIYINLMLSIVAPLLFTTVISIICLNSDISRLKNVFFKSVFILISSTIIAAIIGLVLSIISNVGNGMELYFVAGYKYADVPNFIDVIIDLFPKNIINDIANNKIISVIIFAGLIGFAEVFISKNNNQITKPFKDFIKAFQSIINQVVTFLVELTPYAVLSLFANIISNNGIKELLPLIKILIISYLACLIQIFVVNSIILLIFAKLNPLKFFKKIWTTFIVAFTSQSSIGTLPVAMGDLQKKLGVSEKIASFVTPLGTTIGMPGCAGIWPVVLAVTTINALDIPYSFSQYLMLIIIIGIVSIGTVGVPGTATITTTSVLATVGLPLEIIVITTPISMIVDMIRTATNVMAASTTTVLVAKTENELDLNIFNSWFLIY